MAREMEYVGTIKKCPNCGAEINSFTSICPSCGHELNDNRVNESVKDFFERLTDAYSEKDTQNLIENYVVPNTKESILEFYVLAASLIKTNVNPFTTEGKKNIRLNEIWKAKLNQLSMKAKIALASDPDGLAKVAMIQKEVDTATSKAKKMKTGIIAGIFGAVAIIVLVLILTYVNITGGFIKIPKESFIPAENVTLMGDAAKYFQIGGKGITLSYGEDTGDDLPRISGQLVAQGNIKAEIEKQYKDFLTMKKWNAKDCTTRLSWTGGSFNDVFISIKSDIETQDCLFIAKISGFGDDLMLKDAHFSFYQIIKMTFNGKHPTRRYKKAIANIMNAKTCRIKISFDLTVTNETLKADLLASGTSREDADKREITWDRIYIK